MTANPVGIFIYGFLTKWYIIIGLGGVMVFFWVIKGLDQAGVLKKSTAIILDGVNSSKSVAKYCTPKITNISNFIDCLNNPPKYEADQNDESVNRVLEKALRNHEVYNPTKERRNPYE
jgi:hypothetical protein